MINTVSLGEGGRMVRCARCRATWFAGGPQEQQVSTFVDEVIAEAEAESPPPQPFLRAPAGPPTPSPTVHFGDQPATDNFGSHTVGQGFGARPDQPAPDIAPDRAPGWPPDVAAAAAHRGSHEPETIEDAPSVVPPMEQEPAEAPEPDHDAEDVESFAARRRRLKSRRKQAKRSSRWTAAILVLLAFNVALIGGRSEVVRYMPQTASLFAAIGLPVNLQHLKFENVQILPSGTSGDGLAVEGIIVSTASRPVKVPDLRFAARNAAGQEIYTWTAAPARQLLDAGAKLNFRTELATPPADAKDVLVRFLTEEETAATKASGMKPNAMAPNAMKPGTMAPGQARGNQ
jgi:hypothetical protein